MMRAEGEPKFVGLLCYRVAFVTLLWQSLIWDWVFFYNIILLIVSIVVAVFFFVMRANRGAAKTAVFVYAVIKMVLGGLGVLGFFAGWIAQSVAIRSRTNDNNLGAMIFGLIIQLLLWLHAGVNLFLGIQLFRAGKRPEIRARYFGAMPPMDNRYAYPGPMPMQSGVSVGG